LAAIIVPMLAQPTPGRWRTDTSKHSIDLKELKPGGPGKDGIPALDHPKFVSPAEAKHWLDPKEPVIAVELGGEVRAYPLQILIWHELVNDSIQDTPILISYCPLCNSAVVFERNIGGQVHYFGVSGMLRNSDMVMYDRQTESLWEQITGKAIVGELTGQQLKIVASETVPFQVLSTQFPEAKVLSRETGYRRPYGQNPYVNYESSNQPIFPVRSPGKLSVSLMERLVAITEGGKTKAYPFSWLRKTRIVEDAVDSKRFVIFFQHGMRTALDAARIGDSNDVGAVGVFSPELDGTRLTFEQINGTIVDQQTRSSWNLFGIGTAGPLVGRRLTPVDHTVAFAFAWLAFRPETEMVMGRRDHSGRP
jgi:hypothetical protein